MTPKGKARRETRRQGLQGRPLGGDLSPLSLHGWHIRLPPAQSPGRQPSPHTGSWSDTGSVWARAWPLLATLPSVQKGSQSQPWLLHARQRPRRGLTGLVAGLWAPAVLQPHTRPATPVPTSACTSLRERARCTDTPPHLHPRALTHSPPLGQKPGAPGPAPANVTGQGEGGKAVSAPLSRVSLPPLPLQGGYAAYRYAQPQPAAAAAYSDRYHLGVGAGWVGQGRGGGTVVLAGWAQTGRLIHCSGPGGASPQWAQRRPGLNGHGDPKPAGPPTSIITLYLHRGVTVDSPVLKHLL